MSMVSKNGNGNGSKGWQRWLLGIGATVAGSLIVNGIVFQRDVREQMAKHTDEIKHLQQRDENIIKYLEQFSTERMRAVDAAMQRLERRIEELEKRR
jgi:demethoxyubiquinone hydroxylase (CLK1/Coq7/Cat5 family)